MPGLWYKDHRTPGGKYLVTCRDGTNPQWPYFVLGARDPAAALALRVYADECERLGVDPQYVVDVRMLAGAFDTYRARHGATDPAETPHRHDDPVVADKLRRLRDQMDHHHPGLGPGPEPAPELPSEAGSIPVPEEPQEP